MPDDQRVALSDFDRTQGCPELDAEQAADDAREADDALTTERLRLIMQVARDGVYDLHWSGPFPVYGYDRIDVLRALEDMTPARPRP